MIKKGGISYPIAGEISEEEILNIDGGDSNFQDQLDSLTADVANKTQFLYSEFSPSIFLTGASGDTAPTYSDIQGWTYKSERLVFMEMIFRNTSGGTPGNGSSDRISIDFSDAGLTIGPGYTDTLIKAGCYYESTGTFPSGYIDIFINQNDEEMYLYDRGSNVALSTLTANDQSTALRMINIKIWFRRTNL